MQKRSSMNEGRTPDVNQIAKQVVDLADESSTAEQLGSVREKDPIAVELGRRGGLKGGKARAEKLSAEKRQEIARKAAIARWRSRPTK